MSVRINSINVLDAYEESYQYFEVFRSFLCLKLNSTKEIRFGDRSLKPINKIQLGEVISMHNEDGTNAMNGHLCLIIQNYQKPDPIRLNKGSTEGLKKFTSWAIRKFKTCKPKHQTTVMKALNLYVAAFDERNKHACFLKAWTTLELLLSTDQNDMLIKRISSLYKEETKPYKKQILESLRLFRNEYVHQGESSTENLNACFFAQELIKDLIIHLNFTNSGFFNNIEDASLFLDNLSLGSSELQRKKRITDKAFRLEQRIIAKQRKI